MMKYRTVTLAVVALFLSVSFLASSVVAAEKDGLMMKGGKMVRFHDGKQVGWMDRETTMSNGTRVMMNGKMIMKDGMLDGKMMEGEKDVKMEGMGKQRLSVVGSDDA